MDKKAFENLISEHTRLDYDDGCGGRAIVHFRKCARELNKELQTFFDDKDFEVEATGETGWIGRLDLTLKYKGEPVWKYSQFYDTYRLGDWDTENSNYELKREKEYLESIYKMAKIFKTQ